MSDRFDSDDDEIRQLRESQTWLEAEFRRWQEAQAQTAAALKKLSARIGSAVERRPAASAEDVAKILRAYLDPLMDGMAGLYERFEALAAAGAPVALGDGVPVLTLPSQYHLIFHRETGERLTVLFWDDTGPWFFVYELAELLDPPEEDLKDLGGFIAARVPEPHRRTVRVEDSGTVHHIVSETGLVLLFRPWSEGLSEWDRQAVGRWIADRVIPSALALRLKETELDPERRPKDFPIAPTAVVADEPGLFKVYAGDIDGRPATLVKARDMYKFLAFRQPYTGWFEDRCRWAGLRNGLHYSRVFVNVSRYDHYLTLDAAESLLCQESHPKAIEAREYLLEVAREQGRVIEGEAVRVEEEQGLMPVEFKETTLFLLNHDSEPYVPMKPVVDGMGLAWQPQHRKLTADKARWGIIEMVIPSEGGPQEMVCLPLRRFFGWAMTISPNKVKPEIKGKIIAYQQECDEVLWQHWNKKIQKLQSAAAPLGTPADTPPHQPLVIPFKHGHREIPVRVAIRLGRPWFLAFDVALIVDERHDDPRPAFAGVPETYKDLRPSPDGESAALWLDEAGLAYYLGARPHKPAAGRLRDWLLKEARAALRERLGAVPPASAATVPVQDHYTHRDPLYLACLALAERCFHAEEPQRRRGGSAVSDNYGRLLAWLWRNAPAGDWLAIGNISRLANAVGMPRRSLGRAIRRTVAWGFVEQRPERPDGWPADIRLAPGRLETALNAAGVTWRG